MLGLVGWGRSRKVKNWGLYFIPSQEQWVLSQVHARCGEGEGQTWLEPEELGHGGPLIGVESQEGGGGRSSISDTQSLRRGDVQAEVSTGRQE